MTRSRLLRTTPLWLRLRTPLACARWERMSCTCHRSVTSPSSIPRLWPQWSRNQRAQTTTIRDKATWVRVSQTSCPSRTVHNASCPSRRFPKSRYKICSTQPPDSLPCHHPPTTPLQAVIWPIDSSFRSSSKNSVMRATKRYRLVHFSVCRHRCRLDGFSFFRSSLF